MLNKGETHLNDTFISRIRIYLLIIFIGYFIIKIILAPFGVYSNKYNYKTIDLRGTNIDNNILYDYTPGIWNSELTDFIIVMVMSILLFLFKFNNTFPMYNNKYSNIWLWIPFIIGLILPSFFISIYNKNSELQKLSQKININELKINNTFNTVVTFEFIILIILGIIVIIMNIATNLNKSIISYVIFVILLIAICILLYAFRDKSKSYTDILLTKYPDRISKKCEILNRDNDIRFTQPGANTSANTDANSDIEKCKKKCSIDNEDDAENDDKDDETDDTNDSPNLNGSSKRIIVQSTGQVLEPNLSFFSWVLLLLIPFNNNKIINVINGLLLGYFVSRVSLYGIQYPLIKKPGRFCSNKNECLYKEINYPIYDTHDFKNLKNLSSLTDTLKNRINTNSWTIIGITLIIISLIFMVLLSL